MGVEQGSKVPLQRVIHEAAISFIRESGEDVSEEDFLGFLREQFNTPELRGAEIISLPHVSTLINLRLRKLTKEGKQHTEEFGANQKVLQLVRQLGAEGNALIKRED